MAVTINDSGQQNNNSKTKVVFIAVLFIISLIAFVLQTEFTSQAYLLGFDEPIILLLVTHGSWWLLWPTQLMIISSYKLLTKLRKKSDYQPLDSTSQLLESSTSNHKINYIEYFRKSIVKQFHNVYHTSILIYEYNINGDERVDGINDLINQNPKVSNTPSLTACIQSFVSTPSVKYILKKTFIITLLLTVAGFTWYGSMSMTYASDVTAIYNCSAFTAYIFAIPLLLEKFSWLKANSVIIAVVGVFIVAYSSDNNDDNANYPYRFWGNLFISVGAVIYGLYEVFYKKYCCIPPHLAKLITPKRQLAFANFVMGLLGLFTCVILLTGIILSQLLGIHKFKIFSYDDNKTIWLYIIGSMVFNLSFSASFLSLISLTNPVLSSVSSLLTIFLIGIVEWILFDNKLSTQQLIGDVLVIIGFLVLTIASWQEISEGNDKDDVEVISNYSFALSTNDGGRA